MFGRLLELISGVIDRIFPKKKRKVSILDVRGDVFDAEKKAAKALRNKSVN